jgi:hypothetical protein
MGIQVFESQQEFIEWMMGCTYESVAGETWGQRQERLMNNLEERFQSLKHELRKCLPFPLNFVFMASVATATEWKLCWEARK